MNSVIPTVTVVLILAKIFEVAPVASWSWLWVLSPIWVPVILVVFGILIWAAFKAVTE